MSFAAATFSAGASMRPQTLLFAAPDQGVPNNAFLPLIVWPQVVPDETQDVAAWFEAMFAQHGWPPQWRAGIYEYTHFHPNVHEVLGVAAGWAEVLFGGDNGRVVTLHAGDAVLIPAGIGHKQIHASDDFISVGAYPAGHVPQTWRNQPDQLAEALQRVTRVRVPDTDPLGGTEGAVMDFWHQP